MSEHPEHEQCADGCGLDATHNGPCLDVPGGDVVCEHEWAVKHTVIQHVIANTAGEAELIARRALEQGHHLWWPSVLEGAEVERES